MVISLQDMINGQVGKIINTNGDIRILEFGLIDGTYIQMVKNSNPYIIKTNGMKFCFRDKNTQIMVKT